MRKHIVRRFALGLALVGCAAVAVVPAWQSAESYTEVAEWPLPATTAAGTPSPWNFGQVVAVATRCRRQHPGAAPRRAAGPGVRARRHVRARLGRGTLQQRQGHGGGAGGPGARRVRVHRRLRAGGLPRVRRARHSGRSGGPRLGGRRARPRGLQAARDRRAADAPGHARGLRGRPRHVQPAHGHRFRLQRRHLRQRRLRQRPHRALLEGGPESRRVGLARHRAGRVRPAARHRRRRRRPRVRGRPGQPPRAGVRRRRHVPRPVDRAHRRAGALRDEGAADLGPAGPCVRWTARSWPSSPAGAAATA